MDIEIVNNEINVASFLTLPYEIHYKICSYLPFIDLVQLKSIVNPNHMYYSIVSRLLYRKSEIYLRGESHIPEQFYRCTSINYVIRKWVNPLNLVHLNIAFIPENISQKIPKYDFTLCTNLSHVSLYDVQLQYYSFGMNYFTYLRLTNCTSIVVHFKNVFSNLIRIDTFQIDDSFKMFGPFSNELQNVAFDSLPDQIFIEEIFRHHQNTLSTIITFNNRILNHICNLRISLPVLKTIFFDSQTDYYFPQDHSNHFDNQFTPQLDTFVINVDNTETLLRLFSTYLKPSITSIILTSDNQLIVPPSFLEILHNIARYMAVQVDIRWQVDYPKDFQ